jgi:hypothetical protein
MPDVDLNQALLKDECLFCKNSTAEAQSRKGPQRMQKPLRWEWLLLNLCQKFRVTNHFDAYE